ncbi:hypothetical protein VOLCADRAFT_105364 [Volvox carteri f. nagariensis]|uniref:Uncharacterized protein n=1 Tax=Volvox carteri f. nagariensis TaxID=3068 RepID=D8U0E3_VOLCA|nr:uncharacterized protein VOLCADRAFT_105364 [Volvox carteri f. nagariensis]EFJ46929.1 hypothetical protein VOLCADRAFT_105364 [Volvox carteri f. nagariensis]|eukprot:XP_002952138.1 hypothetical protein VOLCADRAFT_105364 [Volvox carteri f. nagariensis]
MQLIFNRSTVTKPAVDDESRCRDGKGRKARVELDIARYQDYAEYFEGGSPTMNALSQVAEDLQRGVCNTTQAVERIGGALYKVLVRAFDTHRPTGMTAVRINICMKWAPKIHEK